MIAYFLICYLGAAKDFKTVQPKPPIALVKLSKRAYHDIETRNSTDFAKLVGNSLAIWDFNRTGVTFTPPDPKEGYGDFPSSLGHNDSITYWHAQTLMIYKKEKGFEKRMTSIVKYLRDKSIDIKQGSDLPSWSDGMQSGGAYPDLRGWRVGSRICAGAYWQAFFTYKNNSWHIANIQVIYR